VAHEKLSTKKMNQRDLDAAMWAEKTDDELVVTNLEQALKEMMRRLKDSNLKQQKATNRLTGWLIALTAVILLLTAVMAAPLVRQIFNFYFST